MKKIIAVIIISAATLGATAEEKFLQLSLTPDIALQSRDTVIKGIALSIWGENQQSALALGIVNGSTGDSCGFSWGLVNYADNYKGVQFAFVNYTKGTFVGWQNGAVNIAQHVSGLQWGAVNYTETLNGVQLGFINVVEQNPWFEEFPRKLAKGFVFVNWSF